MLLASNSEIVNGTTLRTTRRASRTRTTERRSLAINASEQRYHEDMRVLRSTSPSMALLHISGQQGKRKTLSIRESTCSHGRGHRKDQPDQRATVTRMITPSGGSRRYCG